jgi:hypothetical protein
MDDWWVATANDDEGRQLHRQIVHDFLDKMEECSYFLKPKKCQFEKDEMEILGWLVGGGRVRIDPAKVKGISEWPRTLKSVEEVRKTLGVLVLPSPRPWDFPPSIDGDISRADDPMELDDPE